MFLGGFCHISNYSSPFKIQFSSYPITNQMLFYTNVCANVENNFTRDEIDGQLKSELLTALQPAMFKISQNNIYYGAIPAYTMQLADELNNLLSAKWRDRRGVEIVEFGVSSVNATEEDEARITEYQRSAAMGRDANMMRGHLAGATAQAMNTAAANENGSLAGFMGMNMAGNMMGNMAGLVQGNQPNQPTMQTQTVNVSTNTWKCECGADNTGKFCQNCGKQKPEATGWTCSCGTVNMVNSVRIAEVRSQLVLRFINAINAVGHLKVQLIHQSFALNAAIYLMKMISSLRR